MAMQFVERPAACAEFVAAPPARTESNVIARTVPHEITAPEVTKKNTRAQLSYRDPPPKKM